MIHSECMESKGKDIIVDFITALLDAVTKPYNLTHEWESILAYYEREDIINALRILDYEEMEWDNLINEVLTKHNEYCESQKVNL